MVGDGEGGFVVGDAMNEDADSVIGDEDVIDRSALGARSAGNAVEGVDARGRAEGCNVCAVGQDLLHILDRLAVRVGVEVARDENGKCFAVFFAKLVLLFEHLTDVIDAPELALDGVGSIKIVMLEDQRAVGVDESQLFAAFLVGNYRPGHRFGIGTAAAVELAAALDQIKAVGAVEDRCVAMLAVGVAERGGSIKVRESLKKCGSDAIYLLHTDQIGIARAIVVGNQGETVCEGLIKKDVAGHDANVGVRSTGG